MNAGGTKPQNKALEVWCVDSVLQNVVGVRGNRYPRAFAHRHGTVSLDFIHEIPLEAEQEFDVRMPVFGHGYGMRRAPCGDSVKPSQADGLRPDFRAGVHVSVVLHAGYYI